MGESTSRPQDADPGPGGVHGQFLVVLETAGLGSLAKAMSLLDAPGTLDPPYASARDRVREVLRIPVRCGKCYKVVAPASQAKKPMEIGRAHV